MPAGRSLYESGSHIQPYVRSLRSAYSEAVNPLQSESAHQFCVSRQAPQYQQL